MLFLYRIPARRPKHWARVGLCCRRNRHTLRGCNDPHSLSQLFTGVSGTRGIRDGPGPRQSLLVRAALSTHKEGGAGAASLSLSWEEHASPEPVAWSPVAGPCQLVHRSASERCTSPGSSRSPPVTGGAGGTQSSPVPAGKSAGRPRSAAPAMGVQRRFPTSGTPNSPIVSFFYK